MPNRYCDRLKIAEPRVEDALGHSEMTLHQLMVIAILEHGEPMPLEAIVDRLQRAGVPPGFRGSRSPDLASALLKAWHGLPPVYRDGNGRYGLDLGSHELDWLLMVFGLRSSHFETRVAQEGGESLLARPPDPAPPPRTVPLTREELEAAFTGGFLQSLSSLRQAAAVLDALGSPMPLEHVERVLAAMTPHRFRLRAETARSWRSTLIRVEEGLKLRLDPASPELPSVRDAVRQKAYRVLAEQARHAHWEAQHAVSERAREREGRQAELEAQRLRRAILRVVPGPGDIAAAAVLDMHARTIETFVGSDVARLPGVLDQFDLVAAVEVRQTLHSLGLDADRWRLADLRPPQKTITVNRQGRTLRLTPEMILRGTTGISQPLGDPRKLREYLARGEMKKVAARLEADVKSLAALYRYGVLHGYVFVQWGSVDEVLHVTGWAHPGDLHLHEALQRARQLDLALDVVIGDRAQAWSDPWAQAHRVRVLAVENRYVILEDGADRYAVSYEEIQDMRVAPVEGPGRQLAH